MAIHCVMTKALVRLIMSEHWRPWRAAKSNGYSADPFFVQPLSHLQARLTRRDFRGF